MKWLNANGQDFLTAVFFLRTRCHFLLTTYNNPSISSNWRPKGLREKQRLMEETRDSLSALEEAVDVTVQMSSSLT